MNIKERFLAWYAKYIAAGYKTAWSWWANGIGLAVAGGPDLLNWVLSNFDLITSAMPTLSLEHKSQLLLATNAVAFVLRMIQQKSVQRAQITQQAEAGKVIPLPPSGVSIASVDLDLRTPVQVVAAEALEAEATAMDNQRQQTEPRAW